MNTILKNLLLIITALILSYLTAGYFGGLYDNFSPLYDNTLGLGKDILKKISGFPFAYIFFLIIIFKLFASGNKNKWIGWLIAPALLFFAAGDLRHIYLPLVLVLIAWGISWIIHKSFRSRF